MASPRRTAGYSLQLSPATVDEMRSRLPALAEETVTAIIAEVPGYAHALTRAMGENIRNAVQLALGGSSPSPPAAAAPTRVRRPLRPSRAPTETRPGEARSGRSMEGRGRLVVGIK
jgi:hypothetical protein